MSTQNQPSPHDAFTDHQITRRDQLSLELRNPANRNLWCTITIDDGGGIVVFGDFGPIAFAYSDGRTLEQRIGWMGSHEHVDSYVAEKVGIGMSDVRNGIKVATAEHFEADVRDALKDRREELDDEGESFDKDDFEHKRAALTWEAFQTDWDWMLQEEDYSPSIAPAVRKLNGYLETLGYDDNWEWLDGLGERMIPQVGYAHAALRRAHLLLKADREYVDRCARDS